MKKCEICNKPSKKLTPVLKSGPNGFRRYKVCPDCQKSPVKAKSTKAVKK